MGALFVSNLVLRTLVIFFATVSLGLIGSLMAHQSYGTPQINFMVFASVWSLLFSGLFGAFCLFVSVLAFPIVLIIVDFLTLVFTFAGATALAVNIRVHSCTNEDFLSSNRIAEGSTDRCRKAQASDVFIYFTFVVSLVLLVLSISSGFRNGWGGPTRVIPAPTRPTMAQV
ncbi:membrane-associating domain-containing protein [Kockiozyma suomiensis]|uniref:membrane-associating domain-containing protein n=1 Tax=Kockiozyma suomiensis TaxID=1337062 RepID=UPI003343A6BB